MLASKNGNICFSKEIVMLFSSHATVAPGSENPRDTSKNLYFEKEDRTCQQKFGFDLHIHQVRQMRKLPPPSHLTSSVKRCGPFSAKKGRRTAAQLGQTNLFISSCYVAITMVRIKLSAYSTRLKRMH